MAEEKTISSISEYVQAVCQMNKDVRKMTRIRDYELLFRGQGDKEYELLPSIGRKRQCAIQCTIFNDERNLIEMAKYKLPDVFRADLNPIELLALLQHHGIPTRLLDVTENALVALYFACKDEKTADKDGEVIVFRHDNDNVTNYPIVNAVADTCRFTNGSDTPLSRFYADVIRQPYFMEQKRMLDVIHEDEVAGGEWIGLCCSKILYLYAPVRSTRQQVQHGRYILFPNHISKNHDLYGEDYFEWMIDPIPKDHEDIASRIIIPAKIKKQLLQDLSILGITEDFLFCDSADTVCKGIVDSFKSRY